MAAGPEDSEDGRGFADVAALKTGDLAVSDRGERPDDVIWARKPEAAEAVSSAVGYGDLKPDRTSRWTVQERPGGRIRPEAC